MQVFKRRAARDDDDFDVATRADSRDHMRERKATGLCGVRRAARFS